jgi:hypothetical protein
MLLIGLYEKHYPRILAAVFLVCLCAAMFFVGFVKASPKSARGVLADWSASAESILNAAWQQAADPRPEHFLQPSRKPGAGVTVNRLPDTGDLVLLTGFFDGDPGLRLIRRDGSMVASWRARFSNLLPERKGKPGAPETDWNVDLHGALIEPDGAVVFNFEYQGTVKLDRCGKRLWALAEHTNHSIEPASGGGYWIIGRKIDPIPNDPAYLPIVAPDRKEGLIEDDLILRVDPAGRVVAQKSVYKLLMENGFEPLLTATGETGQARSLADNELLHLNMISELRPEIAAAFPAFAAGDLVLSVRDYNLVFVVDPVTWKVKWHSVGPWLRQHSAQFFSDGTIGVFNNNAYVFQSGPGGATSPDQPRVSNILALDPATGVARVRYGGKPGQEMLSVVRGYVEEEPGGGFLITETDAGRVFQVDAAGTTVWEYIDRYDADNVLEMTGARAYPASYFTVGDWSCG